MTTILQSSIFGLTLIHIVLAQSTRYSNTTGYGPRNGEIFLEAQDNPINETRHSFQGFNYSVDVFDTSSSVNSSQTWAWHTTLGLVNLEANKSVASLSEVGTTNVLNLVQSLEFPGDELPNQNDTNWTLCASLALMTLPASTAQKAETDEGDCTATVGSDCLAEYQNAFMTARAATGRNCPSTSDVDITDIPACDGFTTGLIPRGSAIGPIQSWLDQPGNTDGPTHGLRSGQGFYYELTENFNATAAPAYYNEFATYFQMLLLNFRPKGNLTTNGTAVHAGEVRTMCTVLNKAALKEGGQQGSANGAGSVYQTEFLGWWMSAFVMLLITCAM